MLGESEDSEEGDLDAFKLCKVSAKEVHCLMALEIVNGKDSEMDNQEEEEHN